MNVLLIPDKFKGSLSAEEVITAIRSGILGVQPDATVHAVLASDGGDGFLEAVARYKAVVFHDVATADPLGRDISALYGMSPDSGEAYVELARASGLVLLEKGERDPGNTSTYGTGIQIRDAIRHGARKLYIGLGGSATNDGGTGIASVLGYKFLDAGGNPLKPVGGNLQKIAQIIDIYAKELLQGIAIIAVSDVTNPLLGPEGAAHVYGEQKGGSRGGIEQLEAGLAHLDIIVQQQLGKHFASVAGAGAAGGTAYGLMTFANATIVPGIQYIMDLAGISELLKSQKVDYIITGEGKLDGQTLNGKLIHGVLQLGKRHNIPVVAVCGRLELEKKEVLDMGLKEVLEIRDPNKSLAYNMEHASRLTEKAIRRFFAAGG